MKLNVHVLGRHVGILEQVGDFKSVMTYVPDVVPENLVSLTMPVRTESYPWDDQLHPIFQVNLPEATQAPHDFKPDMLNIAVDKLGAVWVEKKQVSLPELLQMLEKIIAQNVFVYLEFFTKELQ